MKKTKLRVEAMCDECCEPIKVRELGANQRLCICTNTRCPVRIKLRVLVEARFRQSRSGPLKVEVYNLNGGRLA